MELTTICDGGYVETTNNNSYLREFWTDGLLSQSQLTLKQHNPLLIASLGHGASEE
jgi:hypothetical protein